MKKILSVMLSLIMVLGISTTAFAESVDTEPSETEIYRYLVEAGYPADIIDALDDNTRLRYYEGQYQYESSGTSYGIFTEEHKVEYSIDASGEIIIDEQNLKNLEALLNDKEVLAKVLSHKAESSETSTLSATTGDSILSVDEIDIDSVMTTIDTGEVPVELMALSNWTGNIVCSHISYNTTTKVAKKNLTYTWKWEYSPVWTLTDKVAMAWSGGFTSEPDTVYWTYVKRVRILSGGGVQMNISDDGYGYDDYNPNAGVAKGIDITAASSGSSVMYHSGTLSTELTKVAAEESRESAVGRYYHKQILPSISLSFSESGPSISVSDYNGEYDQSVDSGTSFWATKKD